METLKHRTESGHLVTRKSSRDYRFVSVGQKVDGTWSVVAWHANPPKGAPFSYLANVHTEPINGGTR